jgi:chromosomal replication initiation ATPase DnaA
MTDPIVAARREAMARIRLDLGWSYQRIGALFARHHTTVLHHVRTYFEKGGA